MTQIEIAKIIIGWMDDFTNIGSLCKGTASWEEFSPGEQARALAAAGEVLALFHERGEKS